jgi:hypothetical protein
MSAYYCLNVLKPKTLNNRGSRMYYTTGSFGLLWASYCKIRASYETQEYNFASSGIGVHKQQLTGLGLKS